MTRVASLVAVMACAIACSCSSRSRGAGPTPTPSPTSTPATCSNPATQLVYALDAANELLSFDPTAVTGTAHGFARIGTLTCAAGNALPPFTNPATPDSISVDDAGRAWVLYTSGELFLVSTSSASCAASGFVPSQTTGATTWSLFGQAFSTDSASAPAERLWLSGGSTDGSRGDLGSVAPSTLTVTAVGPIGGSNALRPELMGLSDATLWGLFPGSGATSTIQQIDKSSGALIGTPFTVTNGSGTLDAWAVAHWGGRFYVFLETTQTTSNETIHQVDRATGSEATIAQNLPYTIIAAGSSTCVPVAP